MNLIHHSAIQIAENRQRREHEPDAEQELIASLQDKRGLLHALVLRAKDNGLWLVAGERRLRAIRETYDLGGLIRHDNQDVPDGMVPYTTLGEMSPLEAAEAEYEENVRRVDLTWQERAEAERSLLELRSALAMERGLPPPSVASIAKESRGTDTKAVVDATTKSIILANNLHRPEVRAAKTQAEAYKALVRSEETERNVEKAAALGKDFLGGKHQVVNENCLDELRAIEKVEPDRRYDVLCTDPPYCMGADEFGDSGGGAQGAHFYEDGQETWDTVVLPAISIASGLMMPDAHAYIFCDFDRFQELREFMVTRGWKPFRTPLIWIVPSKFRAPWPDQGPQRKYECILYAVKGTLKTTKLLGDVLTYPMDENLGHQAQKPVALYRDLLSRSVRPGMRVLDPFCGTGPVFPAAHTLSAIATGIEQDPVAYAIAVGRVQKLKEGI